MMGTSESQATERQLPFHTMGWLQFQRLCDKVLTEELGQTVQTWEPGHDGGRDAAFFGTWAPKQHERYSGAFVFQVKYSRDPDGSLVFSKLSADVEKAKELHAGGKCDHYIVISNLRVSGEAAAKLETELRDTIGCASAVVFGNSWLTERIVASTRLRMLVPRVYGLGDLGEIIDTRGYEQFRAITQSLSPRLRTFVPTKATADATAVLNRNRFVLLVGDPMTGKSTIAAVLALAAMDHLGFRVLKIRTAEEFIAHWNADGDARQFFWIDDAFGETIYDRALTRGWSKILDAVRAAVEANHATVVMTTRTYIWRAAQDDLKTYAFPALHTNQVVIHVEDLTFEQKQEILYNHVRLGDQPLPYKEQLHPFLDAAARVSKFLPEIARRLGSTFFTQSQLSYPSRENVVNFFERPTEVLTDIIRGLDAGAKAALAVLFANGARLEHPLTLQPRDVSIIEMFGSDVPAFHRALRELNETLVLLTTDLAGQAQYAFAHPTIQDALAQITGEQPEWLDIYLAGANRASILRETSAGPSQAYGVKVLIPAARFGTFADWLIKNREHVRTGTYYKSDTIEYYLVNRCSEPFLKFALDSKRKLFEPKYFNFWADSSSDDLLQIVGRLHKFAILPTDLRDEALARMRHYATHSLAFLEDECVAAVLTHEERIEIFARRLLILWLVRAPNQNASLR